MRSILWRRRAEDTDFVRAAWLATIFLASNPREGLHVERRLFPFASPGDQRKRHVRHGGQAKARETGHEGTRCPKGRSFGHCGVKYYC